MDNGAGGSTLTVYEALDDGDTWVSKGTATAAGTTLATNAEPLTIGGGTTANPAISQSVELLVRDEHVRDSVHLARAWRTGRG